MIEPIRRAAVVRALPGLGDMLCAGPALRSLRAGMEPNGTLALVALAGMAPLARRVLPEVDEVIAFPGCPGIPERPEADPPWPEYAATMRTHRFDLALQMQGDGSHIDAFMPQMSARRTAGYLPGRTLPPDWLRYPDEGHEILRWTGLLQALGFPDRGTEMTFAEHPGDAAALGAVFDAAAPYACLHPGASTPPRRWPSAHFAAIGDMLAATGLRVVLTGTAAEAGVTRDVAARMCAPAIDLAGGTPLGPLGCLLRGARLLVTNDTGVAHLGAATHTPSVIVFLAADPLRWAPLDRERHRAVIARGLWTATVPPADMRLSSDLPGLDDVRAEALALL